jgi:hypothetical protein
VRAETGAPHRHRMCTNKLKPSPKLKPLIGTECVLNSIRRHVYYAAVGDKHARLPAAVHPTHRDALA